jgi:hypothetical protein
VVHDAESRTWVDVAGYQHETVHTGVLATLLEDPDLGPALAARLTDWPVAQVDAVHLEHGVARRKADLVAYLRLEDGSDRILAVETKVHSDGSREQLEGTTEGLSNAAGLLLAVGMTGLKMSAWDADGVSSLGPPWRFIDAPAWHRLLEDVDAPHWLSPYRDAVAKWARCLAGDETESPADGRMAVELDHLRWLSRLRTHLRAPGDWSPIRTSSSGPLLTLWAWGDYRKDVYIQLMGKWSRRRALHLKAMAHDPADLPALRARVFQLISSVPGLELPLTDRFQPGTHRSTTLKVREFGDDPVESAVRTNEIERGLDEVLQAVDW